MVDSSAWVQKASGWLVQYGDLRTGDIILDENLLPVKVKKILKVSDFTQKFHGKSFSLFLDVVQIDVTVAPDHEFMTQRGFVSASDLVLKEDFIAYPRRKIISKQKSIAVAPDMTVQLDRDTGLLCGLFIADNTVVSKNRLSVDYGNAKKREYISLHVSARIRNLYKAIEAHPDRVDTWLRSTFGGEGTETCKIPDWIFETNADFCLGILEGFLVGCGMWFSSSIEVYTKVRKLATRIRDLSAALGCGLPGIDFIERSEHWKQDQLMLDFSNSCYGQLRVGLGWMSILRQNESQYVDGNYVYSRVEEKQSSKTKEFLDLKLESERSLHTSLIGISRGAEKEG